jgi:hypothetical protein
MDILNKICFTLVLFLMTGVVPACAPGEKNIDKERAREIVKKEILNDNPGGKEIYMAVDLLTAGEAVKSWNQVYKVPGDFRQAWFFFVDDQPGANWGHACRYIFVDADNGKYKILKSLTPPDSMDRMEKIKY